MSSPVLEQLDGILNKRHTLVDLSPFNVEPQLSEPLPRPVLRASPSRPMEGSPMTLTCEMKLHPRKPDVQNKFCFFRDDQMLGSDCRTSPELRIPTVWRKDSGSYWCQAKIVTARVTKTSLRSQIHVQSVPVSDVSLETQPPGRWVMEGDKLVLICSVADGTGDITFFWYRGALGLNLETKTQRSLIAEFEIASVQQMDAEHYYCAADNGHGPSLSGLINITVRSPVSRPVLTLRAPRAQAVVGDVVEFHCEALRGSPPILYQFYHEDVILRNSSAPSGGGVSFNLSLTAEHSGKYSCEADNGRRALHSETVTLNVTVPDGNRSDHLTSGVIEGLLGSFGPIIFMALLFGYWLKRKIGQRSAEDPLRSPASPVTQQSNYLNSPDTLQLQPFYENVNVASGDKVYSLVYQIQQEREPVVVPRQIGALEMVASAYPFRVALCTPIAPHHSYRVATVVTLHMAGPEKLRVERMGMHVENKVFFPDIYSRLRKADITDVDYEDAILQMVAERILLLIYLVQVLMPLWSLLAVFDLQVCTMAMFRSCVSQAEVTKLQAVDQQWLPGLSGASCTAVAPLYLSVPVSHPVLTLRALGAQAVVESMVELHCEALRVSPILYQIYHKYVILVNCLAFSDGEGVYFNLFLTAEHSGNYSSEADNGLGAQSETVSLSIFAPGREQSGVPPKAVLLLHPHWSTTFKGETVILRCMDFHSPTKGYISWLYNKKLLNTVSESITIRASGNYQCKTSGSSLSDPVHVESSSDWLILQGPHPVFEGDDVILRCQGKEEENTVKKNYYKDGEKLHGSYNSDFITINSVSMDPGAYHCTASRKILGLPWPKSSKPLRMQVQELFPHPVLTASPSRPIEGGPMTLTCGTQLPPQKPDVQLKFCFFRDDQTLGSGCSTFPELQIPTMWTEDSGSYWCQAVTPRITKKSLRSQIHVQKVPVSNVNLETQPPGGQLVEGHNLVLICSVTKGTGIITFSWHRDGTRILGRKTQHSQLAELQMPTVTEHDAGSYYCTADNSGGPILSKKIRVTVKIPVSNPVLTIRAPRAPSVVGDVVGLHCDVLRGSPPISYLFYHENVTVGNSSAPSGGGAFFNLSLTVEHAGKYSCEADNGLGAQRSHSVSLKVTVPVSRPVFTFRSPRAQAVVGDIVELHCEAPRGSPPILYRFYHENVTLGNISAPLGGGASFNLLLNREHAGNYSCEADNGLGAQHSEVMTLSVIGKWKNFAYTLEKRQYDHGFKVLSSMATSQGVLAASCLRSQDTDYPSEAPGEYSPADTLIFSPGVIEPNGRTSAMGTPSPNDHQESSSPRFSAINPEEPMHSEPMDLQPVYSNGKSVSLTSTQEAREYSYKPLPSDSCKIWSSSPPAALQALWLQPCHLLHPVILCDEGLP
ncbi:LOW QUALITY PROTEIN: Fc receptor-like protein 3 [Erethizon dorsatum]